MPIPNTFNPLGINHEQYVTDGLIFWLDAGYEPKGTKDYITELTTGTKYRFDNGTTTFNGREVVMDGYLNATTVGFPDWVPASTENSVELVACCVAEKSHICACPWTRIYEPGYNGYYPNIRMGWELKDDDNQYAILHNGVISSYYNHMRWIIDPIRTVNCYFEYATPPYLNGAKMTNASRQVRFSEQTAWFILNPVLFSGLFVCTTAS